jgi:hypothetical protein
MYNRGKFWRKKNSYVLGYSKFGLWPLSTVKKKVQKDPTISGKNPFHWDDFACTYVCTYIVNVWLTIYVRLIPVLSCYLKSLLYLVELLYLYSTETNLWMFRPEFKSTSGVRRVGFPFLLSVSGLGCCSRRLWLPGERHSGDEVELNRNPTVCYDFLLSNCLPALPPLLLV